MTRLVAAAVTVVATVAVAGVLGEWAAQALTGVFP